MEFSLNRDFSIHLDQHNDIALVDKREQFEQTIALKLTKLMQDSVIGETDPELVRQQLRLAVTRVARDHDLIDGVESINIARSEESASTYEVGIVYDSQAVFNMVVSE